MPKRKGVGTNPRIENPLLAHNPIEDLNTWYGPAYIPNTAIKNENLEYTCMGTVSFIQGITGIKGNFEVIVPRSQGGLMHFWRNNDDLNEESWYGPSIFIPDKRISDISLISSSYNRLELIARLNQKLYHLYFDKDNWNGPYEIPNSSGSAGVPSFVQGKYGRIGNFEVIVPRSQGGLMHFWRNNDDLNEPWGGPAVFAEMYDVKQAAMIYSSYGRLDAVAIIENELKYFFQRDRVWQGPFDIPNSSGSAGVPSFVQNRGASGNFEVIVQRVNGGLMHFYRKNNEPDPSWSGPHLIKTSLTIDSASLIHSSYDDLEIIGRIGDELYHLLRG